MPLLWCRIGKISQASNWTWTFCAICSEGYGFVIIIFKPDLYIFCVLFLCMMSQCFKWLLGCCYAVRRVCDFQICIDHCEFWVLIRFWQGFDKWFRRSLRERDSRGNSEPNLCLWFDKWTVIAVANCPESNWIPSALW